MTNPYGLTDAQRETAINHVLNQRAELIVDGIMSVLDRDPRITPRVAQALARRLTRRYGTE
ncbi:hypothetical protein GCM10017673_33950 [Streptosporangium violaceochromogenes]|nr:hypothetical protein GCM10017673_33950 [Streptosporangium violaceochromogenes]